MKNLNLQNYELLEVLEIFNTQASNMVPFQSPVRAHTVKVDSITNHPEEKSSQSDYTQTK
jgi:hypothetical protein